MQPKEREIYLLLSLIAVLITTVAFSIIILQKPDVQNLKYTQLSFKKMNESYSQQATYVEQLQTTENSLETQKQELIISLNDLLEEDSPGINEINTLQNELIKIEQENKQLKQELILLRGQLQ